MSVNFIENYKNFVAIVTSNDSSKVENYIERLRELESQGLNMALLDTGSTGLSSESGEIAEVVKKLKYHGKPWNEDVRYHLKRELGDVMWYWMNTCRALDLDFFEVIEENIKKLESRYPGGKFDAWHSENRKEGDI